MFFTDTVRRLQDTNKLDKVGTW